ncbi:MAG: methyltransferase [Bacteroidetes bacterium GWA2_30_7]|nr:MAG: methyltransferase [Bacteroidetes bacterium GWA2_30_7]
MNLISEKLEKYIESHTQPENEVLKELNRFTKLKVLNSRMLSGHIQGQVLKMLCYMIKPQFVLEIGTYTGYSAICMAEGLENNCEIHTIEIDDELESIIQKYIKLSNNEDKIKCFIGDAKTIVKNLNYTYDLAFIDGDKREYLDYYHLVFDKIKPGGFIIADNVLWNGKVIEELQPNDLYTKGILDFNSFVMNDNRVENVIFPIRDGLMVLRKKFK